jgi:hypothetical protein
MGLGRDEMEYRTKKRIGVFGLAVMATVFSIGMEAQAGDPATLIQEKLVTQIKLTKAAADHSDVVTEGDVLVLQKDGLMMCSSASSYPYSNTYNNGVLAPNPRKQLTNFLVSHIPHVGGDNCSASRKFVAGEKFWVTEVVAQKGDILVKTFSEPYPDSSGNQVRYYGEITFPFPKHSVPPVDDFVKTVSEVMTVQPADDQGGQGQPAQAAAPAAAPAPAFMPDPPPPPPSDAPPPTIALGQTTDQVTAAFGQPARTAKVGVKEIFYYKDKKVTFTKGKVSDVE